MILFTGMIEKGLNESATSTYSRTPTLSVTDKEDYLEVSYNENNNEKRIKESAETNQPQSDTGFEANNSNSQSNQTNIVPTTVILPDNNHESNELKTKISRPKTLSTKKHHDATEGCSSKNSSVNSSDTEGDSWVRVNHITPDIGSSATSITSSTCTEPKANEEDKLVNAINELLEGDDKGQLNNSSLKFQDELSPITQKLPNVIPAINDGISNLVSSLRGSKSSVLPTSTSSKEVESETRRWSASNSQNQIDETDGKESMMNSSVNVIDIEADECGLPLCIFAKVMARFWLFMLF